MPEVVSINNLWWRYPTFTAKASPWTLRGITLRVEEGECIGITGPSGAGKTTLCRILLGIIPYAMGLTPQQIPEHLHLQHPQTDRRDKENSISSSADINHSNETTPETPGIVVLGQPVTAATAKTHQIGMVLQDPENQFLRMSVLHELALGLQVQNVSIAEIEQRAYDALRWVGLEHLWHGAAYIHPADLSGGQKQRIAIAAFLAMRPKILIMDEPTSDLDPVGKREVIETIARLRRDYRMTVILVEQDPEILSAFCDRIALLHEGKIALVAPPSEFYAQRNLLEKAGASVGELARISWQSGYTIGGRPPLTLEEGEKVFAPVLAHNIFLPKSKDKSPQGEIAAQAKGIGYRYSDGTIALKGVDLTLHRGEMLALLGPNGSGKTTFAKILAGIYRASQGKVEVLGQDLTSKKVRARLPQTIGYVFQNPDHQLFCRKVRDEVAYGLKNLGIEPARREKMVARTLEAVGLANEANEDPLFLSKGQRQRLAVAAVLAMEPDILIVDEPTTGQDYRSISGIMSLLCQLQQAGKTILVITHDMTLVTEYCQRVVAFRDGQLTFTGRPEELFGNQGALHTTGLRPPTAAALATRLQAQRPHLPTLLTVAQWSEALGSVTTREGYPS
jgi:energy-coupling factor transport system ATP-binding protein